MAETATRPEKPLHEVLRSLREFSKLRVLVIGDLFLDEYIEGEMFEISKEGPIPVVRLESRLSAAGAAGNLASSIRNLGAAVSMVGVVGDDANGRALIHELEEKGIDCSGVLVHPVKPTLTYTKVRARVENAPPREILRLDVLPDGPLGRELEEKVLDSTSRSLSGVDGVIVLDQIHYLVGQSLLEELPALVRVRRALLHGSSREHIGDFRRFDLITPNDREAHDAVGGDRSEPRFIEKLGEDLKKGGQHRQVLLTLGAEGMALFRDKGPPRRMPSFARQVVDVTGAGDAVSSVAVLGNILGWDLTTAAWTSSQAAAVALSFAGTHHVTLQELEQEIRKHTA